MKADDNSAAAASDPKRRGDGPGLNALDIATVHPHRSTHRPLRHQLVRCPKAGRNCDESNSYGAEAHLGISQAAVRWR